MYSTEQKEYLGTLKATLIDSCPKCAGTDLACSCYAAFESSAGIVRSGIPRKYWEASDADILAACKQAKGQLAEYLEDLRGNIYKGLGLYVYGASSSARTAFCSIIVRDVVRQLSGSAAFRTRDEFTDQIKNSKATDKEDQLLEYFSSVNLLVIDNVSFVYRANRADMAYPDYLFGKVVKQRENSGRSTILTADISFMDFQSDLKARHMPDLSDSPGVYTIVCMDDKHGKSTKKISKKV